MQIPVDFFEGNDCTSGLGSIKVTDDNEGRLYIEFGGRGVGINISDLMTFIRRKMITGDGGE